MSTSSAAACDIASPVTTRLRDSSPSCSRFPRRYRTTLRSRSTNVQWAAPRDRASMPSAPVPANRSATRASRTRSRLTSALKTASRTLSVVGRVSRPGGDSIRRPRNSPATTRTPAGYGPQRPGNTELVIEPDRQITCIECGGRAVVLTPPREDGMWYPGDVVAYRCQDCLDRWDIVLEDDDDGERTD